MASVLGLPAGAAFAPQNLDAPVPSTTAGATTTGPVAKRTPSPIAKATPPVRGNRSLRGASPTAKKRTRALRGKSPRGAR